MLPVSHAPISHFEPCFSTMPCEYDEDGLLQQYQNLLVYQQQPLEAYESLVAHTVQEDASCREQNLNNKTTFTAKKQKIPAKKDRHSKINTAQGPRDRRIRMSLEVAKQFFALQDILGFDKASKTVEWLLIQAKDEIINLARGFPNFNQSCSNVVTPKSASSNSECEFVSGGNDDSNSNQKNESVVMPSTSFEKAKKCVKIQRKAAFQQVGKESRERARERARERTKEKMRSRRLDELSYCQQECSRSIPFDNTARSHTLEELQPEVEKMIDDGPMVIMGDWSPSLVFNYL